MGIADMRLIDLQFREKFLGRVKFTQITPENSIDKPRLCTQAIALGKLDRFINRSMIWNPIQPENLVKSQSQQILQMRFWRRIPGLSGNQPIQRGLPPHDAIYQFLT